jgi:prolipoprotein diacylglyceryltransferase
MPKATTATMPAPDRPSPEPLRAPTALLRWLDGLTDPTAPVFGCQISPYLAIAVAGIAIGFAILAGLALWIRMSTALVVVLLVAALATFIGAGLVRKAITGKDRHVLLEDVLLVLGVGGLVSWLLGSPILITLDLLAPALGGFLAVARLGCFRAGCCHGRPSRFGARSPLEGPLFGVRLFPLQLVEALWIAAVTTVGLALALGQAGSGASVTWWLLGYGAGRFVLELARGDAGRPMLGPLSEAQWLFVLLLVGRIAFEVSTVGWAPAMLVAFGSALAVVVLGWMTRSRWLALPAASLTAGEVAEWQRLLEPLETQARARGRAAGAHRGIELRLTVDRADEPLEVHAYVLGQAGGDLDSRAAFAVAGIIAQRWPTFRLLRAGFAAPGEFHLWACLNPLARPGSTTGDPLFEVRLRAQAFARRLRDSPLLPPPSVQAPLRAELLPAEDPAVQSEIGSSWSFADLRVRETEPAAPPAADQPQR